jgi:hypothetical protein
MPKWLKGLLLALIVLTFFGATVTLPASESSKTFASWFLLVPPFVPGNPPGPLQLKAPLGQWTEMDSTETAADCEEQRHNMTRMSERRYHFHDYPVWIAAIPLRALRLVSRPAP